MSAYLTATLGSLLVLAAIFELLRRRQLSEKYTVLWLGVGIAILVLTVFPGTVTGLSRLIGVAVPSNLVFFVSIVFLVGVALHLSWELSNLEDETRRLAEEFALLRLDFEQHCRSAKENETEDGRLRR